MAADYSKPSTRQVHRSSHRSSHSRRKATRSPAPSSSSEEVVDVVDVDDIRRARAEFYSRTPEERRQFESVMSGQGPREGHTHRRNKAEKGTLANDSRTSVPGSTHRRRRRKRSEKEKERDDSSDFVYARPVERDEADTRAPSRHRRRSSISLDEHKATAVPQRVKVFRTWGLQPPERTKFQRSLHSSRTGSDERRHRHHSRSRSTPKLETEASEDIIVEVEDEASSVPRRSASTREASSKGGSRQPLSRSSTNSRKTRRPSPPMATVPEEATKPQAPKLGRSNSVFGTLFGPQRPSLPEKKVTCLTCMDDVPISRSAKLACTHRMCHDCLRRIFTMAVKDPAHMPPKCCTADPISIKHVDKLFKDKFKMTYNRKFDEFTTKNRIYCPAKGCGTWIPPKDMGIDPATRRKYGKCSRCKTKVCVKCNCKWHGGKSCTNDEETLKFQEIAKEEGWQKCYNCSAMVELKEGCNHMTCRCTAEFCMICGSKWKSCDCHWFNYAAVETDRLNHMNIAEVRREPWRADQPRAYHEELERRRGQEQRDEQIARRMQHLDIDNNLGAGRAARHATNLEVPGGFGPGHFAVGNAADHHLNADFIYRATDLLTNPQNLATQQAAENLANEIRNRQRASDLAPLDGPNPLGVPGLRRAATTAQRPRLNRRGVGTVPGAGREAETLIPRHAPANYQSEAARFHHPVFDFQVDNTPDEDEAPPGPPAAIQAGLGRNTNTGRVDAWRRHVTN